MPLLSLLDLRLKPDAMADAARVLDETLVATRAFDGCREIEVVQDTNDPTHWVVVEWWESLAHDQAYRAWRATPEGASGLGAILAAPPRVTHYTLVALGEQAATAPGE